MILQALAQLAEQEGLVARPDYEPKRVSWVVVLTENGSFVNLVSHRINLAEGTKKKPVYVGKWVQVPKQPTRTSGAKAFFLIDKSEYVFGLDPQSKQKPKKLEERFGLFRAQINEAAESSDAMPLQAVANFLNRLAEDPSPIQTHANFDSIESNDLIGFKIGTQWVQEDPKVIDYFADARKVVEPESPKVTPFQCLVSGEMVHEVPLFPLIKRVPGGTSSGVALVSHNASAFLSYGLSGNDNAPISRTAAEASAAALTRLLDPNFPDPKNLDDVLPLRQIKIGANTIVVFWAKNATKEIASVLDMLNPILGGESEETVKAAYRSVWRGKPVPLNESSEFYALTLSGTQGRVVIRDWIETSVEVVNENLAMHFADLKVCRNTKPKKGSKPSETIPMSWLLKSLAAEGRSEPVPPSVESGFVRAAFQRSEYPFQLLQRALVRAKAEAGGDDWSDSMRRDARAAILRAVLNRKRRNDPNPKYPEVDIEMNPNVQSEGYSCGMLMAVLERLQTLALDDINASVVDRFFSAASASPRSVFVRLLKNSQHHYRKVRDDEEKRGFARYLERIKDEILSRFDPQPAPTSRSVYPGSASGIPLHLNLEQQALFVLGYHQMRHWLRMSKEEKQAWHDEHPNVPPAFGRKKVEQSESVEANSAITVS
jgi:CRISPR-associated protein Csd1